MELSDAEWVTVARRRLRMNQSELGLALGVTRFVVHNWEAGRTKLDEDSRLAIERLVQKESET